MTIANINHEILDRSYKRCAKYSIPKSQVFPARIFKGEELITILKDNDELVKEARPFLEILYSILRGSGFSIHLTNKDGVIITIIGDEEIIGEQSQIGIVVGADLSEKSIGTNSIGTAIMENCPVQLSGEEHYVFAYYDWTCSAAVIHNEDGEIIGCVNLTGKRQLAHLHTLGLVVAAVRSIEYQLKAERINRKLYNSHQYLNEVMNSIDSGILALNTNGERVSRGRGY
ncbi:MAG: GAF domain-containing protein [Pelotomaculum sp.]|jgi:transcriptional regulator of acetoin/glycerol metabolism